MLFLYKKVHFWHGCFKVETLSKLHLPKYILLNRHEYKRTEVRTGGPFGQREREREWRGGGEREKEREGGEKEINEGGREKGEKRNTDYRNKLYLDKQWS